MDKINFIKEINELKNNYEMLLLYFGSTSCSVCNTMKPKLKYMLERYPNIKLIEIETEKHPEFSAAHNIFAIPVIILFIQGKETIREARIISLDRLEQKISRYYDLLYSN